MLSASGKPNETISILSRNENVDNYTTHNIELIKIHLCLDYTAEYLRQRETVLLASLLV